MCCMCIAVQKTTCISASREQQRPASCLSTVKQQFCCCWIVQAREDNLELCHWEKGYKDANGRIRDANEGDYPCAKYNKKVW